MKSLFDPIDNLEIIKRINNLNEKSTAEWGSMTVSQMLWHAQKPLQVAHGELKLKRGLIGFLFGKLAKKKLINDAPFEKNLPTVPSFKNKEDPPFEETRDDLINIVRRFAEKGPEGIVKDPHPFFGPMTIQEWDTLQWKHLDHHLRQFGV